MLPSSSHPFFGSSGVSFCVSRAGLPHPVVRTVSDSLPRLQTGYEGMLSPSAGFYGGCALPCGELTDLPPDGSTFLAFLGMGAFLLADRGQPRFY